MEDIRIKYSLSKLKKNAVYLWVMAALAFIAFFMVKLAADGYVGAALYGAFLGAAIACALIALSFSARLPDRLNNSASMAVISKDGVRITDEPFNFGIVRWDAITGFKIKKTGILMGARYFIVPVLADPGAFLNSLSKKKRKVAKHGRRLGGPAAFEVTNAELSPGEILDLLNGRLEEKTERGEYRPKP